MKVVVGVRKDGNENEDEMYSGWKMKGMKWE